MATRRDPERVSPEPAGEAAINDQGATIEAYWLDGAGTPRFVEKQLRSSARG
jgi:hypothetical protein